MSDLRRYIDMMESDRGGDYEAEIEANYGRGTFNFPWSFKGNHGLGVARYHTMDDHIRIDVLDVRDNTGKTFAPDEDTMSSIRRQAFVYIGDV